MNQNPLSKNNEKPLILIVDDQESVFDILGKILSENGYEIAAALNAGAALEFMHGDIPDLILLDIHLDRDDPGKSEGFDVCEKFKASPGTKDIPIIFLTVEENEKNIVKGFELGAVDYIIKRGLEKKRELLARVRTHIELKRARDLIEKQNKELIELNATKDKFFRIIGHDLKNPFSSLLMDSDSLEANFDELDDEKKIKCIKRINNSSQRLYKLLENLLEWARLQTGEITPAPKRIDLRNIADSNVSLYEQVSEIKNIRVKNNIAPDTKTFADERMIDGVFRNLINNAIKFTDKGGKVDISTQDTGKFIEVSISDTGVGIDVENIKKLFRIDGNYSTPDTNGEKGTGLGLILCREFLNRNGGELWVESEPGKGSTFKFTLPKPD